MLDEKLWAATATRNVLSWADCDTDEDDISVGTSTAGNETDVAVCVKESFEEFNGHIEDMVFDEQLVSIVLPDAALLPAAQGVQANDDPAPKAGE